MFNINTFLPFTGFEPRTYGIGSDRSTNWATQPLAQFNANTYTLKVLINFEKAYFAVSPLVDI